MVSSCGGASAPESPALASVLPLPLPPRPPLWLLCLLVNAAPPRTPPTAPITLLLVSSSIHTLSLSFCCPEALCCSSVSTCTWRLCCSPPPGAALRCPSASALPGRGPGRCPVAPARRPWTQRRAHGTGARETVHPGDRPWVSSAPAERRKQAGQGVNVWEGTALPASWGESVRTPTFSSACFPGHRPWASRSLSCATRVLPTCFAAALVWL